MTKIRLIPQALRGRSKGAKLMRLVFIGGVGFLLYKFKDNIITFVKQKFAPPGSVVLPPK